MAKAMGQTNYGSGRLAWSGVGIREKSILKGTTFLL